MPENGEKMAEIGKETQFKKGWGGGPGRPKGSRSWGVVIRELMEKAAISPTVQELAQEVGLEKDCTNQEAIVAAHIAKAMLGDVQAAKWLSEYTDGKPRQQLDLTSKDEVIKIVVEIVE